MKDQQSLRIRIANFELRVGLVIYEHLSVYTAVPGEIRENRKPVALWYIQQGILVVAYPLGIVYVLVDDNSCPFLTSY